MTPSPFFYFSLDWYPTLELKVGARTDWANDWTLPPTRGPKILGLEEGNLKFKMLSFQSAMS